MQVRIALKMVAELSPLYQRCSVGKRGRAIESGKGSAPKNKTPGLSPASLNLRSDVRRSGYCMWEVGFRRRTRFGFFVFEGSAYEGREQRVRF